MKKTMLLVVALLFVGAQTLLAQRTITGTVISADDNMGIPGAQVLVRGTTMGTTTDINGRYSINAPADATHLVFSFMGMETQEIEIGGMTTIDITLSSGAIGLEGVVISALGIQRSDRSLGFATSNVDGDDLIQRSEPDALRALEGRIPGVNIGATAGAAGASTRITIRGNTSFFGDNQPLFVVDGIPFSNDTRGAGAGQLTGSGGAFGNSFNTLDPNDIESIQVLKGAAAAALYGSRAANGVVLITTRSGSRTRRPAQRGTEITVQTSWAWEQISDLPNYQNLYGAGSRFMPTVANGSWGGRLDRGTMIPASMWAEYAHLFPGGWIPYTAQPNNVRDLFQTGFMQDYSFNVSSSNDRGVFNLTASRMTQTGYIPNSHFNRTSISVGANNTLENRFRIAGSLSFSNTDQLGSTFGNQQIAGQTSSFGRTLIMARNWDISLPWADENNHPLFFIPGQTDHPMWAVHHNTHQTAMNRVVSQASIGYDILPWLSVSYQLGYNMNFTNRTTIIDIGSRAAGGTGSINQLRWQDGELESNLLFTITQMLTPDISLQAVVGNNLNQRTENAVQGGGTVFTVPGVYTTSNVENPVTSSFTSKRRLAAVFADVALGYRNFLFLNLTGRNDWSSTLPRNNNSYFYPAITGSFIVTDAFPQIANNYLSSLRLRTGWARVGNDAGIHNDYLGRTFTIGNPFRGQSTLGIPWASFDPNLRPEFTTEIEIGTRIGFLRDRITLDFAWYDRRTTDQIASLLLPGSSGRTSFITNFGEMQNTGVEIALDAAVIRNNNFNWDLTWNFTQNISKVIHTYGSAEDPLILTLNTGCANCPAPVLQPGMPFGWLRGSVAVRDDEGNMLINPATGWGIASAEEAKIADPNARFRTSLISTMRSHGFTLGILFDFQMGGQVFSNPISELIGRGVTQFNVDRMGGRIIPGYYADPNDLTRPLLDADGNKIRNTSMILEQDLWFNDGGGHTSFATNAVDEFSVFDVTHFRLREISLGYEIPRRLLERLPIGSAHISFSARNLWFFAPYIPRHINIDPIANTFGASSNIVGIQYDFAPSARRYGINLRFTF
ncbi:MAG: SusC/RagA family TonB-linked outer membrane protein [Bacteroidales bacterium]|nr:SusC/RagA family TonB-linked outer membrane protein [Bacteroidales bacterium]